MQEFPCGGFRELKVGSPGVNRGEKWDGFFWEDISETLNQNPGVKWYLLSTRK